MYVNLFEFREVNENARNRLRFVTIIEGPLGRAHRRPAIYDMYFGTGLQIRRKSMQFEMGDCRRTVSP